MLAEQPPTSFGSDKEFGQVFLQYYRPVLYVIRRHGFSEEDARDYTQECELPVIGCCCPACGDLGLQRQRVKRLVMELEREHPAIKSSMLRALANVMPRHLLDTRLNPPAALRAAVSSADARSETRSETASAENAVAG